MKNLFVLAVLVMAASALPSNLPNWRDNIYPTGRIINGEDTTISQVPYQASIELFGKHNCGGSIISSEWILTAGHCASWPASYYGVRTGSDTSGNGGKLHSVAGVYRHEGYTTTIKGVPKNDIALFRLQAPIELNEKQQPVILYDKDEEVETGSYAVITGYGITETGKISIILKTVSVPIMDRQTCFNAYTRFGGIQEHQICAAYPEGGKDACAGDSGGPLTIRGRQAGIVSWGNGCAVKGNPGVYTEVSKYRDWITKTTGLNF
ncbi:hypothetical protein KPH14_012265 [Odynerus spinipes]|uniref:Chymotrypsin-2 n=1 Tax=Odynerus spinipes TaxID=1348599 RepID=A0AAD9RDY4_9HYME|nr:hypothetical protein KPH14_012265 [Odynerus spinipes]